MATKVAQSIQNTCTASNNVVDVSSHCEVVCKSDTQDRDCHIKVVILKGGSRGPGSMPPVVSVYNIFARGCWRSDIPRSLHPSAFFVNRIAEGVGITPSP